MHMYITHICNIGTYCAFETIFMPAMISLSFPATWSKQIIPSKILHATLARFTEIT